MNNAYLPGWYGKLPGAGDFVSRRLDADAIRWWANWLQRSLQHHNERYAGWQQGYIRAPLWNFMLPGSAPTPRWQLGCIAPSCDRVGRYYPLCLMLPTDPGHDSDARALRNACQRLTRIGYCMIESIRRSASPESFDQALAEHCDTDNEPHIYPWPELAQCIHGSDGASYWWTNPASGGPLRSYVHHGAPNNLLFNQLFGDSQGGG
ncbi:hypothetical protein D3C76_968530 [compost metagenome]